MPARHSLYGLRIFSSQPIPGLALTEDLGLTPLRIQLKDEKQFSSKFSASLSNIFYTSPNSNRNGDPILRAGILNDGAYYGFFYSDGPRFAIDRQGREIYADWPDGYTLEEACRYLIGQVINFVLRLRGITSLHASSIAIADRAIAIVGGPGAGKSTTAAAFARLGYSILSDDVAVLDDHPTTFLVQPGYPRLNLWPDSTCTLLGPDEDLPRIAPRWEKRYLSLRQYGYGFHSDPLPLSAIYLLDLREDGLAALILEELTTAEVFIGLVANTYLNCLLDLDMRKREFEVLGRVAKSIPVRRVCSSRDPSKVFELCEAIAADAKRIRTKDPLNGIFSNSR